MRDFIDKTGLLFESTTLEEMPISAISHLGDWNKGSSFRSAQDRKLLTNDKAITKIKTMWRYPDEVNYNILLINNAEANLHTEVGLVKPEGNSPYDCLPAMFPKTIGQIQPLLKGDHVNIIFTNNKGSERVPLTGWVMAHRFGHAISRGTSSHYFTEAEKTFERYLTDLVEQYRLTPNNKLTFGGRSPRILASTNTRSLISSICTFKSARDNNLRNSMEAMFELFAQYIITGKCVFNDIPRSIRVGQSTHYYRGDADDYDSDNRAIQQDLSYELGEFFATAIHYAEGKIFVM